MLEKMRVKKWWIFQRGAPSCGGIINYTEGPAEKLHYLWKDRIDARFL